MSRMTVYVRKAKNNTWAELAGLFIVGLGLWFAWVIL